jgi:hydroxymethylglutaryl-CoA lyase
MPMERDVTLREVGPRDGIQLVTAFLSTERKLELIRRAALAGIDEIEVSSFVPVKVLPQFADADVLCTSLTGLPRLRPSVLVPNRRGAERALAAGMVRLNYVVSVSEAHSQANVRRSTAEAIEELRRIAALRQTPAGREMVLNVGLATSFGCTIQGDVAPARVIEVAGATCEAGADELNLADTVGYGNPAQVRAILADLLPVAGPRRVMCHFHDTRGLGLANLCAALEAGVRTFDASIGGLGGCPFAPGATGNIDSEDAVYLLESLGLRTGIDIDALLALRRDVETWLPGERFAGTIARAGLPKTFRPAR